LLARAYPVFKREYFDYWCADHHQTPVGLAANRDLSDPALGRRDFYNFSLSAMRLRPELAAEAETLDFTPIYAGDVRACVPLQTNCVLVRHAKTLAWMAAETGWPEEAAAWQAEADQRAALIQKYCWNEAEGFFFEDQFQRQQQLPFWSLCTYGAVGAGVATAAQAERLVPHLARFEPEHGLTQTDQPYPSPHPEFRALQFNYPNGWPPFQIMVIDALTATVIMQWRAGWRRSFCACSSNGVKPRASFGRNTTSWPAILSARANAIRWCRGTAGHRRQWRIWEECCSKRGEQDHDHNHNRADPAPAHSHGHAPADP